MEGRPAARPRADMHRAADRAGHLVNDIESHAAAGKLRDGRCGRETGQEQKTQQFRFAHGRYQVGAAEAALDNFASHALEIDAASVVLDGDDEHAGPVSRFQPEDAAFRLARGAALLGRFKAVIDGVAQQVRQRSLQLVENVAVHLRRLSADFQTNLLVQKTGEIADHPREALHAVGEGTHAAADDLEIQPRVEILGAGRVVLELGDALRQTLPAKGGLSSCLGAQTE